MNEKAQALITMQNGALTPGNFEGLWRLSEIMAASGMMPKNIERPETVFVAVQMGLEVGLSPMQAVQNIAVVNGRPTIWGDAMLGLVRGSGLLAAISETTTGDGDATTAVCTVTRRDDPGETVGKFSVADAKRAGLWGKAGPWTQYPRRMLQMRARGYALRDKFADVLNGLYAREEVEPEQYMGQAEVLPSDALLRQIRTEAPEHTKAPGADTNQAKSREAAEKARESMRGQAAESGPKPLDLAPSDLPTFADALTWIETSQDMDALNAAMDAARSIDMDQSGRDALEAAAAAQAILIELQNHG